MGARAPPEEIRAAVARMDTVRRSEGDEAWSMLRPLGAELCASLREAYPGFRKWQGRLLVVYHSIAHARVSEDAIGLGLAALDDRATLVRYRACGLLAHSLRAEAIAPLERLLEHADATIVAHARAAFHAIRSRNHHLFVDRSHGGRSYWEVNPGDRD